MHFQFIYFISYILESVSCLLRCCRLICMAECILTVDLALCRIPNLCHYYFYCWQYCGKTAILYAVIIPEISLCKLRLSVTRWLCNCEGEREPQRFRQTGNRMAPKFLLRSVPRAEDIFLSRHHSVAVTLLNAMSLIFLEWVLLLLSGVLQRVNWCSVWISCFRFNQVTSHCYRGNCFCCRHCRAVFAGGSGRFDPRKR